MKNYLYTITPALLLLAAWMINASPKPTTSAPKVFSSRMADSLELVRFYNATGGPDWTVSWDLAQPMDTWFGVELDGNGCVTCLDLDGEAGCSYSGIVGNNLVGELVDLTLPSLTSLYLNHNSLFGEIPDFLNLPNLAVLSLGRNLLTGSIPNFSNLQNLTRLWLHDNQLSGSITDFSNLPNLVKLDLSVNFLKGEVPDFSDLPNLEELVLFNNQLSGSIPDFSNLSNLVFLNLHDTQLSGSIPNFSNLPNLVNLYLGHNNLSGSIPNFSLVPYLSFLVLWDNKLTGCYPDNLSNLCGSTYNLLDNPGLPWNGDMQRWCDGEDQFGAPCDDGDPNTENDLITDECACAGTPIPVSDCQMTDSLALVELYNATDGPNWNTSWDLEAPYSIWYGITLNGNDCVSEVRLPENNLSGSLPTSLTDLSNLTALDISDNDLNDQIPVGLSSLPQLNSLHFGGNRFTFIDFIDQIDTILALPDFQYTPQIPVSGISYMTVNGGSDLTLTVSDFGDLPSNIYYWTKNGQAWDNPEEKNILNFPNIQPEDGGLFSMSVENTEIPNLTLQGEIIDLTVEPVCNPEADSLELVRFYNATGGPDWTVTWDLEQSMDTWFGVELNEDGCVTCLDLDGVPDCSGNSDGGNNLTGELIDLSLPNLNYLFFSSNQLNGQIPNFLYLPELLELDLVFNTLIGPIPDFSNLPNLLQLDLQFNQLSNTIPDFSNLESLEILFLGSNNLTGQIPDLSNLPNLKELSIDNNQLSGVIPDFSNLTKLSKLSAVGNELTGIIPNFSNLPNLSLLLLNGNQLSGAIPDFSNLPILTSLLLAENQLTEEIPDFSSIPLLRRLELSENQLSGVLPGFLNLKNLEYLDIRNNLLIGTIPNFSNLPDLSHLLLSSNQFSGAIPNFFNLTKLSYLWLQDNQLVGCFPDGINYLCDLGFSGFLGQSGFNLLNNPGLPWNGDLQRWCDGEDQYGAPCDDGNPDTENDIITEDCLCAGTVVIPEDCRFQDSLVLVSLYNATNGPNWTTPWDLDLPMDTWEGVCMTENGCVECLELDGEVDQGYSQNGGGVGMVGELPDLLLPSLRYLNLANNQLEGTVPDFSGLGGINDILLNNNRLEGQLPDFRFIPTLNVLSIDDNQLSGTILDFTNLPLLSVLSLDGNQYTNVGIPNFPNLPRLGVLSLRNNELTGTIPDFSNLPKLTQLYLRFNNLEGTVPLFSNCPELDALEIYGNQFTFEDILPNFNTLKDSIGNKYYYAPQDSVFVDTMITASSGDVVVFDLGIDENIGSNLYRWDKGGALFTTIQGNNKLAFNPVQAADGGNYSCTITNENAPDLELYSRTITLQVLPACDRAADSLALATFYQVLTEVGDAWINPWNLLQPMDTWYGVTLSDAGCVERLEVPDNNMGHFIPVAILNLQHLQVLDLSNNKFTGCIPGEKSFWCQQLTSADISGNVDLLFDSIDEYCNPVWDLTCNPVPGTFYQPDLEFLEDNPLRLTRYMSPAYQASGCFGGMDVSDELITVNCNPDTLVRTYNLQSENAGSGCTHRIPLRPLTTADVFSPADTSISCDQLFPRNENNLPDPAATGYPRFSSLYFPDIALDTVKGGLQAGYEDTEINYANGEASFVRAWTVTADCEPDNTRTLFQNITFCASCRFADSLELVRFYETTGGPDWTVTWDLDQPMETWKGIVLNQDGCVQQLVLASNNVSGTLIDLNLLGLTRLVLEGNELGGAIPDFFSLPNLEYLSLGGNLLSGSIPNFSNLPNLRELHLWENQLTGSVPNFANISNLRMLDLRANQLTGQVPDFSNLPNLQLLRLRSNQLTGTIPDFSMLPLLSVLELGSNQLTGLIPNFSNLPALIGLTLESNQLSGVIPELDNLSKLRGFYADYNQLSGTIPGFSNLLELTRLSLSNNQLSGQLPDFSQLPNLLRLTLTGNQLTGCFPAALIDKCTLGFSETYPSDGYNLLDNPGLPWNGDIQRWCDGEDQFGAPCDDGNPNTKNDIINGDCLCAGTPVILDNCRFQDSLVLIALYHATDGPNWKIPWDALQAIDTWSGIDLDPEGQCVEQIDLSGNGLDGSIPPELGELGSLNELCLSFNQLGGTIPDQLSDLSEITFINLESNELSGPIPNAFGKLKKLNYLDLGNNRLTGTIPIALDSLPQLEHLLLDNNQLSGSIPVFKYLPQIRQLELFRNQLSGTLPPELFQLTTLEGLNLDFNELSGSISSMISQLTSLQALNLSHNYFSGPVPDVIQGLANLSYLDLAVNQFSGSFPSLVGLPIETLRLSDNLFSSFPDHSSITSWLSDMEEGCQVDSNQLTFKDIIYNMPIAVTGNWVYAPQDSFFVDTTITIAAGSPLTLDLGIDQNITSNIYQWYRNEAPFVTVDSNILHLQKVQLADAGVYRVEVTNPGAPELTLYSRTITIQVQPDPCPEITPPLSLSDPSFCAGEVPPLLQVTAEPDVEVFWFALPAGGEVLHQGPEFQPAAQGTYYAEAVLIENASCVSETRTPVILSQDPTPIIGLNRQPDCFDTYYVVSLNVNQADSVWTNADSTLQNGGVYTLFYLDLSRPVRVEAFNGHCSKIFELPPPNCGCAELDLGPPTAIVQTVNFCPSDQGAIPVLVADVPEGMTVRWYQNAVAGEPLVSNSKSFQPPAQGVYFAETYDPVAGCRSNERTAFYVFQLEAPFIREYERFCEESETSYQVVLEIEGADALLTTSGTLVRGLNNLDTVYNIPITESVTVLAVNQTTQCQTQFETIPPECTCADIEPPVANIRHYEYCEGETPPQLSVGVPAGAMARWYDAPDNGNLLASGATFFNPTRGGTYYAETYFPEEDCFSRRRIGIEVIQRTSSQLLFDQTSCRASELGSDTLTFVNTAGCDSLVITNTYLEPLETTYGEELVCLPEEVGLDTLLTQGDNGCSAWMVVNKLLAEEELDIIAEDDEYEFEPGQSTDFIDLLENDVYTPDTYNFYHLELPPGSLMNFEIKEGKQTGVLNFTAPELPQNLSFQYVLCYGDCPQVLCDTATVNFLIDCDVDIDPSLFDNVFTPNGDGANDYFNPLRPFLEADCPIALGTAQLTVTDQYGQIVFRSDILEPGWDGNDPAGRQLPTGTYYFQLVLERKDESYESYVDLIR